MAFNIGQGFPIEVLHTFLLGLCKYLWEETLNCLRKESQRRRLEDDMSKAPGYGLKIRIKPKFWVKHAASMMRGKDYKAQVQIACTSLMPLAQSGELDLRIWLAWESLGTLGRLLYTPVVPRLHNPSIHENPYLVSQTSKVAASPSFGSSKQRLTDSLVFP